MSVSPGVSIVIASYNHAASCREAIDSALAQTLPPIEVIVVDDGSSPPLRELHPDARVRLLRLDQNYGPSYARNFGVRQAAGDWIAFLDADDLWLPGKLESQLAGQNPNEGRFLTCNALIEWPSGAQRPYNCSRPPQDLDRWLLLDGCALQTSGFIMPKRLALSFPFDERYRCYEDWDLALRLHKAAVPIVYDPHCFTRYRRPQERRQVNAQRVAEQMSWLLASDCPASPDIIYRHYLRDVFRNQLFTSPVNAGRDLVCLARRSSSPLRSAFDVAGELIGRKLRRLRR